MLLQPEADAGALVMTGGLHSYHDHGIKGAGSADLTCLTPPP